MRSVVKHSYIKASSTAKGTARAHLHYIQHRGGHDKEAGGRQFFDREVDESSGKWFRQELNAAPNQGAVMHKLILSPGCRGVDLHEYTREVMESLGDSKGLELNWQAVVHTNTDHDHVHVVVLGRDRNGRAVKFNRHDHDVCRAIGDRYLERKHEFDRYFDKSVDEIFRSEAGRNLDLEKLDRGIDLEKLFRPFRDEPEKESSKKVDRHRGKERFETQEPRAYLPARKKNRKQRLMEARGRNDFYHDLYVSNMNKQRLLNLREAQPERSAQIEKELAEQERHDEGRRAEIARKVAHLDRILGLTPARNNERAKDEHDKSDSVEPSQSGDDRAKADQLLDEFIEKKQRLEKEKDQEALKVLQMEYARKVFKKVAAPTAKPSGTENENKQADKKEQKLEPPKEAEPSFEPLPDPGQLEIQIDEPALNELEQQQASEAREEDLAGMEKKLDEFEQLLMEFQALVEQRMLEREKQQKEKEREEKEREEEEKENEREEEER